MTTAHTSAASSGFKGRPGIIATITKLLADAKNGISIGEIVDALVEKFPDRDARAMRRTVHTQLHQQRAKKKTDETRGAIYFK